eukprot:1618793-Pleurochrysis_carterae.AAC.3
MGNNQIDPNTVQARFRVVHDLKLLIMHLNVEIGQFSCNILQTTVGSWIWPLRSLVSAGMAILFAAAAVVVAATAHGAEPSGLQQGLSYGRLDKSAVQLYAACVVARCRSTDASNKWESSRLKASLRPRGGATSDSSAAPSDEAAVPKELAVTKAGSKADATIAREWATEGKLAERKTMDFVDSLPHLRYVRTHGIKQFVSIYKNMRNATYATFNVGSWPTINEPLPPQCPQVATSVSVHKIICMKPTRCSPGLALVVSLDARRSNELLWGDEIEYMLVQLDRCLQAPGCSSSFSACRVGQT